MVDPLNIPTLTYLFMIFGTINPTLEDVGSVFYKHLSRTKLLEKARNQSFPFACFKLEESQKAPYFVHLKDLANVLDTQYRDAKGVQAK